MTEDEATVGRLDIHYADPVIHATLQVDESFTSDSIQDLIDDLGGGASGRRGDSPAGDHHPRTPGAGPGCVQHDGF